MDQVLLGMSSDRLSTLPSLNEQAFVNLIELREAKSLQIRMIFFTYNGWGGGHFRSKTLLAVYFSGEKCQIISKIRFGREVNPLWKKSKYSSEFVGLEFPKVNVFSLKTFQANS